MIETTVLDKVAFYSKDRIKASQVSIDDFITTDNILQNKTGIIKSIINPKGTLIKFEKGDVLVGNIRPYLKKIWFADKNGGCSPDVLVFKSKPGYDNEFLYYSLFRDDFFIHMMKGKKGTKMPRGDKDQILNFIISDFSLPVQKKTAEVLSTLDYKILHNKKINEELESLAKIIYDYWFVQFDFPNAKGKPYKSSGGKMVWSEKLKREIPEGWEVGTLLNIAEYINGLPCQKFRPTGNDFLRVIKIKEMHEGYSSESELVRADIPKKAIIENGDVLFSWSASLEVQIWTRGKGALNQHIFKVISDEYPRSFYYYQLVNYLQHFKMMAATRKTTMGHITQEHLQQSRIAIPPKELTLELEKIIAPIFAKKLNNEIENQKLSELRDWLLPMLMNGQVKVKDAEEMLAMAAEPKEEYLTKKK